MALSDTSKINIALKKVKGKAQTSNTKELSNESIGSNVIVAASTVFGHAIPTAVSSAYYAILGTTVERVRLTATAIDGTKDGDGRYQAFELKLPSNYQAASSNTKAGTAPFLNNQVLNTTSGSLQIIPSSFGAAYTATAYHTSSAETQIAALDDRDWVLDYYNGVFFQQDPPTDSDENPVYVDAFIYIGDYVGSMLSSSATAGGPTNSVQFKNASNKLTGSSTLMYVSDVLKIDGSLSLNYRTTATMVTASANDYFLGVDSTSAGFDVRLQNAASLSQGQILVIKDEGGYAHTHSVTVRAHGSQTIDGQNKVILQSSYAAIQLYCNGTDKYYIF